MSEIRVPVTAPGAQKAAQDLRGVQQAAHGVGKAEEQATKASTKLAGAQKLVAQTAKEEERAFLSLSAALAKKQRAEEAAARVGGPGGRSGGAFQALGRAGGVGGGMLGRIGGGLGSAQLGALGPVAAGAAVAGFALMKLAEISNHAVERQTALVKAMQTMRAAVESGTAQRGSNALSAVHENGQVIRRLASQGIPLTGPARMGLDKHTDGPEAAAQLAGFSDFGKRGGRADVALDTAKILKKMGVTANLTEGLGKLSEDRVANAMGGSGSPISRLLSEVIGESRGGAPISSDELNGMMHRANQSNAIHRLDRVGMAEGGNRALRMGSALDPAALTPVLNERAAWADPINTALLEITHQQELAMEERKAAANAEMSVIGMLKEIFTPGGSFETQLRRAIEDRSKVASSVSY